MTAHDQFRLASAFRRNAAMFTVPGGANAAVTTRNAADGGGGGGGTVADMWLYGVIGSFWDGLDAAAFADQIKAVTADTINLRVHSPGGSVFDGLAILNALRNHPARVVVTVDGLAASIASVIAQAGDEVRMSQGSQLMIHDAWAPVVGNAADHRDVADWLDKQSANIASVYAARAGGTAAEWRAAMTAETWFSAEEAVAAGLADTVLPAPTRAADTSGDTAPGTGEGAAVGEAAALAFDLTGFAYAGRDNAPAPQTPGRTSAGGSINTEGGSAVAFSTEQITNLRATLGLPETADEAAIVAAVSAVVEDTLEEQPVTPPAAATASVPEGMALVEADVLADLRAGAEAGRAAAETLRVQARDQAITDAVRAGKITPARRDHWVAAYDADAEGTAALLASLAPGLHVPTEEAGHATAAADADDEDLFAALFGPDTTQEG